MLDKYIIKGLKKLGLANLAEIEGQEDLTNTSESEKAKFVLRYYVLTVGHLWIEDGEWHFEYDPAFKEQEELKPLDNFPDVDKHYKSESLWPFFALRIPSIEQPAVKRVILESEKGSLSKVEMLKRFGKRTISNPFDLEPV